MPGAALRARSCPARGGRGGGSGRGSRRPYPALPHRRLQGRVAEKLERSAGKEERGGTEGPLGGRGGGTAAARHTHTTPPPPPVNRPPQPRLLPGCHMAPAATPRGFRESLHFRFGSTKGLSGALGARQELPQRGGRPYPAASPAGERTKLSLLHPLSAPEIEQGQQPRS